MHFLTIPILLFSNLFIQISASEATTRPFYTRKIDNNNNAWVCFPEGQANITDGFKDQFPERLVVYLYKNPVTEEIKAFVPGPDKQALIPNLPAALGDTLKPVTTQPIDSLFNNQPDVSNKGDPIGLNRGKIKTISSNPAYTDSLLNQLPLQNQNAHSVDLPFWTYNNKPQFNLQDGYPTFAFNFGSDLTQEINLYDDVGYPTIPDAKTQVQYNLQSTSKPTTAPESSQTGLTSVKPEAYNPQSANKYLTFDQWFTNQMKAFQEPNVPDDIKAIDSNLLRSLVQKKLVENQFIVDSTGLITDANGIPIDIQNLELRPILIGNSFNYQSLTGNPKITLSQPLPYLEGILITLLYPPKILGVIPLGKTYVSKTSPLISSVKGTKVDTPALIKRYYTGLGSSPVKPSNPLTVTVLPFINHFQPSSSKKYQKSSSALNPFSVTGSLSSSLNLPLLPNLHSNVSSTLFSKSLFSPETSGSWIRRSNGPKESEELKNKAAKLIKEAKELEEKATKLEHERVKLEKKAKKEAKRPEHEAKKLEKKVEKEVKKLIKEIKKLKKHSEKSKGNKNCSTPCSEPKDKSWSGPTTPSGPKPSAVTKAPSRPKPPFEPSPGPKSPAGPKPETKPHPPPGPKPETGPQQPSGPKPQSGPHSPPGPKPESGPQPPPGPKPESSLHPPLGPNPPLEPKSPLGPKTKPGSQLPSSPKPESGPHSPPGPKSESGPHLPSGTKPNSDSKSQSKLKSESEKSYRRLGSQDLPPYNLDWDRYPNRKSPISSQSIGALPASKLQNIIWGQSSPVSNSLANRESDSDRVLDSNAGYLTAIPYNGKWNFPPNLSNNHPRLVVDPVDSKWNLRDSDDPKLSIRPLDNKSHFDDKIESKNPSDSKWNDIPKWDHIRNDGKYNYPYTQDSSSLHLIATPLDDKLKSDSKINKSPKWGDNQNGDKYKYPLPEDSSSPHLIATPLDDKFKYDSKINNKFPKWSDNQNSDKYKYLLPEDSSSLHLIATPLDDKWKTDTKINNKSPKWGDNQNGDKYKYLFPEDSSSLHLIATPLDDKWKTDSKINNKSPKWGDNQNYDKQKYPSAEGSGSLHLIATPIDDKWKPDSKINIKSPKQGYNHDSKYKYPSVHDSSSQNLIAPPFISEWSSNSKIKNNYPEWVDNENDYEFKYYPTQYNDAPKLDSNNQWAAYIAAHKNAPHSDVNSYNAKWTAGDKSRPKKNPHYDPYNYKKKKAFPNIPPLSFSPYFPWKNLELFNTVPKRNSYSPKSYNPDVNRSRFGLPNWQPSTKRPKSPVNNARRTYDQLSAEVGNEESIDDFQPDNNKKGQHGAEETPSRRFDLPIQSVLKSILDVVLTNLIQGIGTGGGKRRMADEPIDINATATNPIEIEGAEDDHPDFRIIGGSAATGSGSPLSNKGRSGSNLSFK